MGKQDSRTGVRLPHEQVDLVTELVRTGKFKSISDVVRHALAEFLKTA